MPAAAGTLRTIFADALPRTGADRAAFLDAACAGDAGLRADVAGLLAAHDRAGGWLARPGAEAGLLTAAAGSTDVHAAAWAPPDPVAAVLALLAPPAGPDALGRLDHYDVLEVVGRGGFGTVLRAHDTQLGRPVALKLLAPHLSADPDARRRFAREARAAAGVRDDYVVAVHAVRETGPAPYLVMEYVAGGTLADRLRAGGPVPVPEALRIGAEIARGLAAAHARGLVHRDVKPANVLLDADTGRARLTDFGLARAADGGADAARVTAAGTLVGTPAYMSPEQARGYPLDARSDLFSLGVVLYQMTTGGLPFQGSDVLSFLAALALDVPPAPAEKNPLVPAGLSDLIVRLLARDPAARPASATAVAGDLREIAAGRGRPRFPTGGTARRARRWGAAIAALALASLLAAGGQVFRVKTAKGTLEIETDDPNVQVVVRKDGAVVRDASEKGKVREIELAVGEYTIELTEPSSGLKLSTDKFEITRNGRAAVKVRLIPAGAEPAADPGGPLGGVRAVRAAWAARAAIGWVMNVGGRVEIRTADRAAVLKRGDPLPAEPFTISTVSLECVLGIDGVVGTKLRALPPVSERLNLDSSAVTDADLRDLAGCPGLRDVKRIDLGRTAVTGAGLKHLAAFRQLAALTFWHTPGQPGGPTGPDLASLRGLKLTVLSFEHCWRVGDDGMAALATLPLAGLDLVDAGVTDAGVKRLRGLTGLTGLRLSGPGITDTSVDVLAGFRKLIQLSLTDTAVTDAGVARLAKACPDLEFLALNGTAAAGDTLSAVAATCPRLRTLILDTSAVSDDALKKLRDLPALTTLSLEGNGEKITDAGLKHLAACRSLGELNLKGTSVTASGLDGLAAKLPGCRIGWNGGTYEPK